MDEELLGRWLLFCSVVIVLFFILGVLCTVYIIYKDNCNNSSNNIKIDKDYVNLMKKENKEHINYIYSNESWINYGKTRLTEIEHIYYNEPLLEHKLNLVFVDFRNEPHFEYIIKNALIKLKGQCMVTFVCGPENYNYIKKLCNNISENIYIINENRIINSPKDYNKMCYDINFWKKLKGEKILIHQFDAFILNSNINKFINYDYIGGYWYETKNNTHVGNGGLSIRTKKVIINILENFKLNKKLPEDIFFGNILKNNENLGFLADDDTAKSFSIEGSFSLNKFGCHKFWKDGVYFNDNIIV